MFNHHPTALESRYLAYAPQGAMPYRPSTPRDPEVILSPGERVLVLSTWDREHYLPGAVLLAYVLFPESGECTHVPVTDLRELLPTDPHPRYSRRL